MSSFDGFGRAPKKKNRLNGALHRVAGKRLLYGQSTLLGHQLAGEERFGLEWHATDDSVW